jgi:hypothetical protein
MDDKCRILWDKYTNEYNALSDKLTAAGISTKLLRQVVTTRSDFDTQDIKAKLKDALKTII